MKIEHNVPLKDHTTFRTGGFARLFSVASTNDEIVSLVKYAQETKTPLCVLGGGSNVLVGQKGFDGLVIKIATDGIVFEEITNDCVLMKVEAGVSWDECVKVSVDCGLYGLENLSLIPGTVGAAPIQNIGAYGSEVAQVIDGVTVLNMETMNFETISKDNCLFGYRDSIFKKEQGKKYVVVSVSFILKKTGILNKNYKDVIEYEKEHNLIDNLKKLRQAIVAIRTRKLPDLNIYGTAGSFFKNPVISSELYGEVIKKFPDIPTYPSGKDGCVKVSAAFLIDKGAQMKGIQVGHVGTYQNQALVLVNHGNATGEEVLALAGDIVSKVERISGITLEMEVQKIGF